MRLRRCLCCWDALCCCHVGRGDAQQGGAAWPEPQDVMGCSSLLSPTPFCSQAHSFQTETVWGFSCGTAACLLFPLACLLSGVNAFLDWSVSNLKSLSPVLIISLSLFFFPHLGLSLSKSYLENPPSGLWRGTWLSEGLNSKTRAYLKRILLFYREEEAMSVVFCQIAKFSAFSGWGCAFVSFCDFKCFFSGLL